MLIKSIGYFFLGFFHMKISLSFTYALELVPNRYKSTMTTIIAAGDAASPLLSGFYFKFIEMNTENLLKMHFMTCLTGSFLFIVMIPESPRWLFLQKGVNSHEAIKNLNFIAWFNGSPMRVPYDATFDIVGQVIEEDNATVNMTAMSKLTQNMSRVNAGGSKSKGSILKEFY